MDDTTATEQELARILREEGGHTEEDIAYYCRRLRVLIGVKKVTKGLDRKVTDKERTRAHVLLEGGASVTEVIAALTKT